LLVLAGCVPTASLETAAPAEGNQFKLGLTSVVVPTDDGPGAGVVPYLSYAWGNGKTEFSISSQMGLRGAVKQLVADDLSVEGGLTIMWTIFGGDIGTDIPFTADLGVLYDINKDLTFNLRGMYLYATQDLGGTWGVQSYLTYFYQQFAFEGGIMYLITANAPGFTISAAYRF